MSVKRYRPYIDHTEELEIIGAAMKEHVDGDYVLYSDYATIEEERDKLAQEIMRLVNMNEQLHERHNALREAVKKYLHAHDIYGMRVAYTFGTSDEANIISAARAEVDRLLEEK